MNKIEIDGVTKRFGDVTALSNITLTLEAEKIYGLLGRNGAGKTTLLNLISNRLFPSEGEIRICGLTAQENDNAQANVFMMAEKNYYPDGMRVSEVFKWTNQFYQGALRMDYALKLCDAFRLNPKKKLKQLSTGYSSIYKIITALSLTVPFLLLDEPVLGLDANHRDLFYQTVLENYAELPRTIVLSTHLIEEVSGLIEEVIIIKEGRVIKQAASEDLLASGYAVSGTASTVDDYIKDKQCIGQDTLGGLKTAYLLGKADKEGMPSQLEISKLDLQKLFIQLTNH